MALNTTDQKSWGDWWSNANLNNQTQNIGGGQLIKQGNIARWTNPQGQTTTLDQSMDPAEIARLNPGLAASLKQLTPGAFSGSSDGSDTPVQPQTATPLDMESILSLFGQDISGLGPTTRSGTTSSTSTRSGLDSQYINQLMGPLMGQLVEQIGGLDQNVDRYTNRAAERAGSMGRNLINDSMAGILDKLSARGMINSTTGQGAIGDALTAVTKDAMDKTYGAGMEGAKMKFSIPEMLGRIGELGKVSRTQGSSGSSSMSQDTLAPFKLIGQMIQSMQ